MAWDSLGKFFEKATSAGVSRERIGEALEKAGWRKSQVNSVMDAYSEDDLPIAVPKPSITESARELFLYLLLFTSLYMCVIGLGTILYQLINMALPDPQDRYGYLIFSSNIEGKLRWATATLLVFLPTYVLMDFKIEGLKHSGAGQAGSRVRRNLAYLALFVTGFVLLMDAVYLIDSWFNGQLGRRVLLKCVVVAGLAGLVFSRYLLEMSSDERNEASLAPRIRFASLGVLVGASLLAMVLAIINVDSPATERKQQADRSREVALDQIDSAILSYNRVFGRLPETLDEMAEAQHVRFPKDPDTSQPYRYEKTGELTYTLCTSFNLEVTADDLAMSPDRAYSSFGSNTFVEHPAGEHCFEQVVERMPGRSRSSDITIDFEEPTIVASPTAIDIEAFEPEE